MQINDVGRSIRVPVRTRGGELVNLATATDIQFICRSPAGVVKNFNGFIEGGAFCYDTLLATDFDEVGDWYIQVQYVLGGSVRTANYRLSVGANLSDAIVLMSVAIGADLDFALNLTYFEDVTVTFGWGSLIMEGLEQATGSVGPEWATSYPSFPGICIASNGWYVAAYRRAGTHGPTYNTSTIRVNISTNQGRSWRNRTNEIFVTNTDGVTDDPYSAAIANINGELWLTYEEDYQSGTPNRLVFLQKSLDNGLTWGAQIQLPAIGTLYTSACGKFIQPYPNSAPNTVIGPVYWRDVAPSSRYSTGCIRSTNANLTTPTFALIATIAEDPVSASNRQFEETQFVYMGTEGHVGALIRVDDTAGPGSGDPTVRAMTYWSETFDGGVTWSALIEAFPGCGWPAVIRLNNGILVSVTRNLPAPTVRPGSPFIYTSQNNGQTWEFGGEFGDTTLVNAGSDQVGYYMYADLIQPSSNVVGICFGQDQFINTQRIAYVEYGINNLAPPVPAYISRRSCFVPLNPSSTFITYNNWAGIDGASRFSLQAWVRPNSFAGQEGIISRSGATLNDRQFRLYFTSTGLLEVGIGLTTTTEAFWNGTNGNLVVDIWNHIVIQFDGTTGSNATRLRVWINGVEITAQSFSGTIPATIRTPASSAIWVVGSNSGNGVDFIRDAWLDDICIWPGQLAAAFIATMYGTGQVADPALVGMGTPGVQIGFENNLNDIRGNLGNGTIVGAGAITRPNIWTPGAGYLMPES